MEENSVYSDLKIGATSQCIPIFSEKRMPFFREENFGYVSIIPPDSVEAPNKLLNKTVAFILKNMNGNNSVNDLYNIMIEKYGNKYSTQIERDLSQTILDLWSNNIIKWKKGANPLMENFKRKIDDSYSVRVAFDTDIKKILEFMDRSKLIEGLVNYKNPVSLTKDITPLIMRYSLFSMNSIFFLLEKNSEVKGIFACNISPITTTANVDFVIAPDKKMIELIHYATQLINIAAKSESKRIRFFLKKDSDENLKKILEKCGFQKIAFLDNEVNGIDIEMLDWNWEKKVG